MKARYLATPLTRFCLISALAAAGPAFLLAQPAGIPPAGGGLNMPPGAIQPPMYQSPPYMAPPVMPQRPVAPTPPPGYRPPSGYHPPVLAKPSAKSVAPKKTPTVAAKPKPAPVQTKKATTYRPPSTKSSSKSRGSSIETKVARLENNDFRQDMRLGHLERNVGLLPDSIEGGGVADLAPIGSNYIVRPGDTMLSIASRHGTSTNVLRSLNHMDDDDVSIGQSLLIPHRGQSSYSGNSSFSGVHIVKSGDTFTQIARDNGISTDALARANTTVYPDRLLIGERLFVPGGRGSSHVSSFTQPVSFSSGSKSSTHTVRKGEHLGSIAKKYGISTTSLARANRLKNANIIEIGDRLTIPGSGSSRASSQPAFVDHDVEPLADFRIPEPIAPLPPIKPEPIAALPPINGGFPAIVAPQPDSKPRGVVAYRMERGDTLDSVANMFSTTTENIRALNKFSADKVLKEGNELFVPSVGAVSVN